MINQLNHLKEELRFTRNERDALKNNVNNTNNNTNNKVVIPERKESSSSFNVSELKSVLRQAFIKLIEKINFE